MAIEARKRRETTPVERARRHARRVAIATELAIVACGAFVYIGVRDLTRANPQKAVDNAHRLFDFEQSVGIDYEHALNGFALDHPWLRDFANWIYIWGHWPVILTAAAWLFWRHRERYVWLRNAMFASGMIGFFFFALVPMAPPRLAGLGFVDTITVWSSSYRVLQPPDHANIYAAMPSLHFGWDLLVGVALLGAVRHVALRILALAMPTLMAFAVLATANHWVLDVVVGFGVVTAGVVVSEALAARSRARESSRAPMHGPRTSPTATRTPARATSK